MQTRNILIFSGYNQRAIIAFLRVLEKNKISYIIIARDENDSIFNTKYRTKVIFSRESKALKANLFHKYFKKIGKMYNNASFLIAPTSEALNRFLLENRDFIENEKFTIPLVNTNLYKNISDKYSFCELCKKYEIKIPKVYNEIEILPLVAKPKKYYSSTGKQLTPYLLYTANHVKNFKDIENIDDFFFQEFIGGQSIYLLYYFFKDGTYISFSQENLVQQPEGKSIVVAKSADYHKKYISKKFIKLFKGTQYFGLVMVELKYDNSNFYMIEANPRFWGPSQLFVDANVPIFECFLNDNGFNVKINLKKDYSKTLYSWYGGVMQTLLSEKKLVFHNYNINEFVKQLPDILEEDIYRRPDTFNIFKEELKIKEESKWKKK